jgi:hypothetical protein
MLIVLSKPHEYWRCPDRPTTYTNSKKKIWGELPCLQGIPQFPNLSRRGCQRMILRETGLSRGISLGGVFND